MRHAEVHLLKNTDDEIELAQMVGLIDEQQIIVCNICGCDVVFLYVVEGDQKKLISCEDCLRFAISVTML